MTQLLNDAYDILKDPRKKNDYDSMLLTRFLKESEPKERWIDKKYMVFVIVLITVVVALFLLRIYGILYE